MSPSSSSTSTSSKTILFLGATGGVGLSALRRSLAANHTCIALCRTPSNLTSQLMPQGQTPPANLHIVQGDAHDAAVIARCLSPTAAADRSGGPVDTVVFSIGARPTLRGMSDPHVCERGITALLAALRETREARSTQGGKGQGQGKEQKKVRLMVVSTTGISDVTRDVPLAMLPLYKVMLHTAHMDKRAMERLVMASGDATDWTIVRGSLYTNGPATEGLVRVGMDDPVRGVLETKPAIGYTISREDVGKWVFDECIEGSDKWVGKAAMITY
ncbi:oxidoreductase AflX [Corynascus novoguineensis]|uniref:Oxidoreductase AflX n=1 Tax=Corynascus novoguineensis TaxID=1126955 RepID=A0AAN7CKY7_9PEZI|nr:oxidoreductase AflX [Corynascus novoguineensis]